MESFVSSQAAEIRQWVVESIRDESVALAADVDYVVWASETTPRVFVGQAGFLGSRNRGRLPFFEVSIETQTFGNETGNGGTMQSRITLRLHDTGRDIEATHDRMYSVMCTAISAIRDNREYNYMQIGNDEIEPVQPGPMGWLMNASITVEHSYDRETYGEV